MEVQVRRFGKAVVQGHCHRIPQADTPDRWYVRAIVEHAFKLMTIECVDPRRGNQIDV